MNRLQFLKRLAALPLVAMAAPFVLSAATEAPEAESVNGGYVGAATSVPVQFGRIDTIATETGRFTAYAEGSAGDWEGYWTSADGKVISWLDKAGRVSSWLRDEAGQLTAIPGTLAADRPR